MASKRNIRKRQCTGKVKFDCAQAAWDCAHHHHMVGVNVYKCRFCSGYHIGHMNAYRRRQRRQALAARYA
jgi:hypothetical protein